MQSQNNSTHVDRPLRCVQMNTVFSHTRRAIIAVASLATADRRVAAVLRLSFEIAYSGSGI